MIISNDDGSKIVIPHSDLPIKFRYDPANKEIEITYLKNGKKEYFIKESRSKSGLFMNTRKGY